VVHEVRCARIERPAPAGPLVVYEMHWADLSRFPGTLRRFVLTLYGMLFQISTIALEALRAHRARTRAQWWLLETFSYLTAVLAIGLTAGAAILGIEFAALVRLTERWQQLVIAGLTLTVVAALAWIGDGFLRSKGWRFGAVPLGLGRPGIAFGIIAAGVGVAPLVLHATGRSLALSVHDVLWSCGVRWVLPITWGLIGLTAVAIALAAANVLWRTIDERPPQSGQHRSPNSSPCHVPERRPLNQQALRDGRRSTTCIPTAWVSGYSVGFWALAVPPA